MTVAQLRVWWDSVSLLDPLNWAAIALVLFAVSARRHTKTYGTITLPNKGEVADLFFSVGTIYGAFNIFHVLWTRRPLSDAKSGVFYLLAALMGGVVENAAKLPLGLSVAPTRPSRKRKQAGSTPVPVPLPLPESNQVADASVRPALRS
jgi:hypothetical protein